MNSFLSLSQDSLGIVFLFILFAFFPAFRNLFNKADQASLKKSRGESIDFIRGVSITGIVSIHLSSYYNFFSPESPFSTFALTVSNLARFSVPAFIISSGIYLSYSSFYSYWKGKISGLLLPYSIVFAIGAWIKFGWSIDLSELFFSFVLGNLYAPYYFVPLLMQAYFIFPALRILSQKLHWGILFAFSLIITFASNHIFDYVDLEFGKWESILLSHFLFFFVIGHISSTQFKNQDGIGTVFERGEKNGFFWRLLSFFLVSYIALTVFLSWKFRMDISNHLVFYPLAVFLFLNQQGRGLEQRKPSNKVFQLFCMLGRDSLGIFLLHPIVIHLFHSINPYDLGWAHIPFYFLVWGLNLAIPWALWKAATKILSSLKAKQTAATNLS
ncbi:adhesion protein [Leptospira perolatii]|uniref:Adhesion protein n=1 Tax=Leptospira perolatii TaxID=2023191 RepID=A0A2M9ZPF3_9LEPT|nr:acyltransferase [Leptospira perolatii]PJZ70738.1 adhesion protein [Leptospira perolatii]PJZ73946.1 adhesion protein [Leptospira perolatii]